MLSPEVASTPSSSSAISTPIRPQSPLPAVFTIQDLELLHFYTTTYVEEFYGDPKLVDIFRMATVTLAVDYPFLMHELLSVAAFHLASLRPHKRSAYLHASDSHAAAALALFQPEIANLTEQNCHACFAFSTLLYTQAWATQDVSRPSTIFFPPTVEEGESSNIQWIKLQRGTKRLIESAWPYLSNGPLAAVFTPWKDLDPNREDIVPEEEERVLNALAEAWSAPGSVSEEHRVCLDETLRHTKRVFSMIAAFPESSKLVSIMTWFTQISDEYLEMLERKIPQAILIVMVYCVALQHSESLWWMKGKAENLLHTMLGALGPGWERWTRWPIEKVFERKVTP